MYDLRPYYVKLQQQQHCHGSIDSLLNMMNERGECDS